MKRSKFDPAMKPVGILGGGQLARMLVLAAHDMGLPIAVLSERRDDPAAQVCSLWREGSLKDAATLAAFLRDCSLVTFESEFLDAELLGRLSRESGTSIFPRPRDMAALQDRATQKRLLVDNRLPTADYDVVANREEARAAFEKFSGGVVFKKRRFGYDGYGTYVVRDAKALTKFDSELSFEFGFIAEKLVKFKRELAVMAVRSANGETQLLPFVESFQENSRCLWVKGPLDSSSPRLKKLARSIAKFLSEIEYVGAMGIELFDTGKELLVNELAPRVHNSGHYSIDALSSDQFTLHLKAVLGLELGKPFASSGGFAMMNLLGSSSKPPSWSTPTDVKLHWYGKNECRPGRKMGHITAVAATPARALALVRKRRSAFEI